MILLFISYQNNLAHIRLLSINTLQVDAKPSKTVKCDKCSVRIPKSRQNLIVICDMCRQVKHYKNDVENILNLKTPGYKFKINVFHFQIHIICKIIKYGHGSGYVYLNGH